MENKHKTEQQQQIPTSNPLTHVTLIPVHMDNLLCKNVCVSFSSHKQHSQQQLWKTETKQHTAKASVHGFLSMFKNEEIKGSNQEKEAKETNLGQS